MAHEKEIGLRAQRMTIRLLRRILFRLTHGDQTEVIDAQSRDVERDLQADAAALEHYLLDEIHRR